MALDPYDSCPCGSGKKFKWCCQPIHVEINKAFEQDAAGQHEVALRSMDAVAAQHPGNPEVWGRKAQLLYQMDKVEEAESALQKAFELSPNYPFGHYLRGKFRQYEGEIPGALILFRKAAELYDPAARQILGNLHALIADCELRLNRPVAARAALETARRFDPAADEFAKSLDAIFGEEGRYPLAARRAYAYQSPPAEPADRRAAWDRALGSAATGKLGDAARAFQQLVQENDQDAAAWYNLGLTRAWQGDHPAALEALDRYVVLEPDTDKAAAAWALAEVLRLGQGMEEQADYVEHSAFLPLRDPKAFLDALTGLERERRLFGVQVNQENGILTGLVLEPVQALTPELAARATPRLGAYLLMGGPMARVWHVNRDSCEKVVQELGTRAGDAIGEAEFHRGPAQFSEVLAEGLGFPVGSADEADTKKRMEESYARYLEETWIHRPLHSLGHIPAIDAAGHANLRKKLCGVVQFLEECGGIGPRLYDFNRLRRKLGLLADAPVAAETAAADFSALNAAELAQLSPESLTDEQAEEAYQAALKLDAREIAARLARNLIGRSPRPDRPDRFALYGQLVQQALTEGDTTAALDFVNEGEKADCEHNQGRRRNDYELRRAQIQARRGDIDLAQETFERLIARDPSELRFRGSAAEAMLSARQGPRALRFAQEGLEQARKQNQRDSEEYFKELVAAAQK
jgi:tetratricopeptide (TPR) repeat protein